MSNKTCGECKYYITEMFHCQKHDVMAEAFHTCEDFEPKVITNGDKLAGDRNYMAAVIIAASGKICHFCAYYVNKKCTAPEDKNCFHGVVNWLNAPADCVKQNAKNDTQTDLCKTDYTESEGGE